MSNDNIALIIVLYNPTKEQLFRVRQLGSSYRGVIVDNSPIRNFPNAIGNMSYLFNDGQNLGIAEAQNRGLRLALEREYDYFVFLDQDSRVEDDYPCNIVAEYLRVKQEKPRLAILGPLTFHQDSGEEYKSVFHSDKYGCADFIIRREIISSGSCISRNVISEVGLLESGLFIDYVDFEWCWRAESKGFICGLTPKVRMEHKVGQRELKIGKYEIIISAPFRYYYQNRNLLWLLRRAYVPIGWKFTMVVKTILRLIYFPLFIKGGFDCWKYMIKGIKEGMER